MRFIIVFFVVFLLMLVLNQLSDDGCFTLNCILLDIDKILLVSLVLSLVITYLIIKKNNFVNDKNSVNTPSLSEAEAPPLEKAENGHNKTLESKYDNAYKSWVESDDDKLMEMYRNGSSLDELCDFFGRNTGGIASRIRKLNVD